MPENLSHFPPEMFLTQVVDNCPKAASLYIKLWKKKDDNNVVTILRKEIRNEFLESNREFFNHLMLLTRQALINVYESKIKIEVEMVGWDMIESV